MSRNGAGEIVCESCSSHRVAGDERWIEVAGAGEYYCPMCQTEVRDDVTVLEEGKRMDVEHLQVEVARLRDLLAESKHERWDQDQR